MPDQAACLSRALAYYPERVRKTAPLIHCITNYVTAGDVANLLLAAAPPQSWTDHPGRDSLNCLCQRRAGAQSGNLKNRLRHCHDPAQVRLPTGRGFRLYSIRSASVCPPTADTPPAGFCRTSPSPSCGEIRLKSGRWRICLDIRWRRNSTG